MKKENILETSVGWGQNIPTVTPAYRKRRLKRGNGGKQQPLLPTIWLVL